MLHRASIIFSIGAGQMPSSSTESASTPSTRNSRPIQILHRGDPIVGDRPEDYALDQPQVIGRADHQDTGRQQREPETGLEARQYHQELADETRGAGQPEFASANSTMKAANFGITLTTPP